MESIFLGFMTCFVFTGPKMRDPKHLLNIQNPGLIRLARPVRVQSNGLMKSPGRLSLDSGAPKCQLTWKGKYGRCSRCSR